MTQRPLCTVLREQDISERDITLILQIYFTVLGKNQGNVKSEAKVYDVFVKSTKDYRSFEYYRGMVFNKLNRLNL